MSWFLVIIILLTLSVFLLVANYAWDQIEDPLATGLNGTVPTDDASKINNALSSTGDSVAFFDSLLPFLLIGIFGFVMLSAGSIMRSPVMIFIGVILLGVLILIAVVYSNLYGNLIDSELSSSADNLTIGSLFMQYLPMIVIISIILVIVSVMLRDTGGTL